ncbi:hypothetical protein RJT34_17598 [Clitoria ternatea]|uniref:DUF3741 domain-containing protein n=1 Tax=Clitoria ternatea TaxID=43366 RepID=A0AAN9J991_CLITE
MAKPENAKPGCFSEFFHLLFCAAGNANTPPMHPSKSNHIAKPYATESVHCANKDSMTNISKPGVVARLMGLDSLPNTNFEQKRNTNTPDSVSRSRSVNFVDYLLKFDANQTNQVKTSASFREFSTLFQQKKHDLLLYLDSGSSSDHQDHKVGSFLRIQEVGLGESRQRKKQGSKNKEIVRETKNVSNDRNHGKSKRISKFKDEPRVVLVKHSSKVGNQNEARVLASVSACSKNFGGSRKVGGGSRSRSSSTLPNKLKKVSSEPKHTRKTRKQESPKKIETECSSENLSPISVLDDNDYSFLFGPDFLDFTCLSMSKTKLESSEQQFLVDCSVEDRASKNNKGYSCADINREKEYISEVMLKLRKLTENDLRESDRKLKGMCDTETLEEICLAYEHTIFDILLHELVSELVELSY